MIALNPTILSYVAIGLSIITLVWLIITQIRLNKLWRGKKGVDIEDIVVSIMEEIRKLHNNQKLTGEHIKDISRKLQKSIRGVETIRFNPFKDQGSNQSFAIALLNEEGDGVIISSLYSRDRMSIFAKPIKNMSSEFELTEEEKEALTKAKLK